MQIIVLQGLPGAGKGTVAQSLVQQGFHKLALGEILRNKSKTDSALKHYVDQGILIPDKWAVELATKELRSLIDRKVSIVVDGFPSTLIQYHLFADFLRKENLRRQTTFIYLECDPESAIRRILSRQTCSNCGEIYNRETRQPRVTEICDLCQNALFKRAEDDRTRIIARIAQFEMKTSSLLVYAAHEFRLNTIDATQPMQQVRDAILAK